MQEDGLRFIFLFLCRNEEQQKQTAHTTQTTSNLDELKKLGDLLANNIITQEEFDTKKKELLNL